MYQTTLDRAAARQKNYNREAEAIRGDASLSEQGKREQLANLFLSHQRGMQKLLEADAQETQQERIQLETRLFGLDTSEPGAVIAHRDAADRAGRVKRPDEAMRMLSQAVRTGDRGLARAMFARAWEGAAASPLENGGTGWRQVVETYISEVQPDARESAERLDQLLSRQDPTAQMRDRMLTTITRPREIGNADATTLANAAAGRTAAAHPGILPA